MTERARVEIESIAAGGDGVARVDGLVVFVPRTAPGDVGVVEYELRGRLARGRMVELERASPARVEPPCPHYTVDRCGGCQIQHLGYEAQLAAKARIISDALERIGGRAVEPPEVRPSPTPWRYRRKLTLALRRVGSRWVSGLHPYDAPGRVFDLADCPITDERVLAVWGKVREASRWLPRAPKLRVAVRLLDGERASDPSVSGTSASDWSAAVVVEGGDAWEQPRRFFDAVPSTAAVWWEPEGGRRRLMHDRRREALPGASFVQVNPAMAERMLAHVVERVLAHRPATVVDGYAGAGDTAVALADRGVRVTAVELDREAAAWAAERLPAESRAVAARVEDVMGELLPADVVILNPPRAGVDERVTAALVARPPRAIVYVSCNPATLARDVARLPGFRPAGVVAFDMFPQTAHVETVCELVPEGA